MEISKNIFLIVGLLCSLCFPSIIADSKNDANACEISNYVSVTSLQKCTNDTKEIRIRNSKLNTIPSFQRFPLLTSMKLIEVGLTTLDNAQFSTEQKITNLDLSKNVITLIPANAFVNLSSLKILNLAKNKIKHIDPNAFSGLASLENLNVAENQFVSLEENVFQPLVRLRDLKLTSNKIEVIDSDLFSKTVSLKTLDLSNNSISVIEEQAFRSLGQLETLLVGSNPLYDIDFMHLTNIRTIDIDGAKLTSITVPKSLRKLFANSNNISRIFVPDATFLETLELNNNSLTDFYNISQLSNVRTVDLASNGIKSVNFSRLSNMKYLEYLDLYGNSLKEFDAASVHIYLPKLNSTKLATDHWNADYTKKFLETLNKTGIYVEIVNDNDEKENNDKHTNISDTLKQTVSKLEDRIKKLETDISSSNAPTTSNVSPKSAQTLEENYEKMLNQVEDVKGKSTLMLTLLFLYIAFQGALYVKKRYFPNGFKMRILLNNRSRSAPDDTEPIFQEPLHAL